MAVVLLVLGGLQFREAAAWGPAWGLLAWSGTAFLLVAIAYVAAFPELLGKRSDGRIDPISLLALLPYFLSVWTIWLVRLISLEHAWDEVAPGLFLGRWPASGRLPSGVRVVVDMTAEFPARASVRASRDYLCLPTLDTALPSSAAFASIATNVARSEGRLFVHCGAGHGRGAIMAAAILLCRGAAKSVPEAVSMLKAARPRVRLGRSQHLFLEGFATQLAVA
jgi:protein-tyrosine phosphatase